jgi:hypothetical protein
MKGADKELDQMFERAMSVHEFARMHGWPLPQRERFKWRQCLLVILGAILATLLLGQLLESLRVAERAAAGSAARESACLRVALAGRPTSN